MLLGSIVVPHLRSRRAIDQREAHLASREAIGVVGSGEGHRRAGDEVYLTQSENGGFEEDKARTARNNAPKVGSTA